MTAVNLTSTARSSATLTVSSAHAALPPRSPSATSLAPHREPGRAPAAWSPPARPAPAAETTARAQSERRREEERHIRSLARVIALACVEAELGLRPARQLATWLDLPTYGKMVRRSELADRARTGQGPASAPRALGSRCCPAGDDAYEASATVQLPDRVRAMALRIERHRDRWKVTALELG